MKSIKQVEITNFQSHAHTIVNFTPAGHLTVITGNSDSGKTSILRGLRWVFYNAPQGTDFIRVGCTSAKVTVTMDEGWAVTRLRTPSKNQYIVTHPSGDEQVYEGFGTNVPAEVQQVLGVSPVDVGDIDLKLNIAEQLDGPFLGNSIASSFRAKVLGKLAGTEDVDVANKQLGTDLYRHNRDLDSTNSQLEIKKEQIDDLAWVESLGLKIVKLESLATDIKSKQEQLKDLKSLKTKLDEISGRISNGKEYLVRYQGVDEANKQLEIAETTATQKARYEMVNQRYNEVIAGIQNCRDQLQILWGVEVAQEAIKETTSNLQRLLTLGQLSKRQIEVSESISNFSQQVQLLLTVEQAHEKIIEADTLVSRTLNYKHLRDRYCAINTNYQDAQETYQKLIGAQQATDILVSTSETLTKLILLKKSNLTLLGLQQSREKTLGSIELATATVKQASELYSKTLHEAGLCPYCGATTHEFKLKEVI